MQDPFPDLEYYPMAGTLRMADGSRVVHFPRRQADAFGILWAAAHLDTGNVSRSRIPGTDTCLVQSLRSKLTSFGLTIESHKGRGGGLRLVAVARECAA
jgi:hypothetical protein